MRRRRAALAWLRRRAFPRRAGALLGVLALVIQMGAALAHDPLGLGADGPFLAAPLCHAGATQNAPAAPGSPDRTALCPLCLGLAACAAAVLPAASGSVAAVSSPPLPQPGPRAVLRLAREVGGVNQPRAPPGLA